MSFPLISLNLILQLLGFENKKERNFHDKKWGDSRPKRYKRQILDASRIFRIIFAFRIKKVSKKKKRMSRKRQKWQDRFPGSCSENLWAI